MFPYFSSLSFFGSPYCDHDAFTHDTLRVGPVA